MADLPVDVHPELRRVQLVAPTSTDERIALAAERTDGWLYLVTVAGTTGARAELSPALAPLVERARALTGVPLYAGFGISTPAQAAAAAELADGVVVGSAALVAAEEGTGSARALRRSAPRCARLSDEPVAGDVPRFGACVEVLEVARVREHAELAGVACAPSGSRVARRDAHRDGVVALAVQDELRDAEREALARRGEHVALEVHGRVAEQRPGRRRRGHEAGGEGEVEHAGLRDDGANRDARIGARGALRQRRSPGRPERELSSGRVANSADVREVEWRVQLGECVDPGRDVEQRLRPPAARADAAVLEVPRGDAVRREVDADPLHQRPVVLGAPVPAVDDDADGKRPGARREEELPELARVGAVRVRRSSHAPGRIRTCGLALRRRALYPLSYGRGRAQCNGRTSPCRSARPAS